MQRMTESQLNAVVTRLNQLTHSPEQSWTQQPNGTLKANVGNYHLYHAYGSVSLVRMHNESGGVESIIGLGTKRELYAQLQAYIAGIQEGRAA